MWAAIRSDDAQPAIGRKEILEEIITVGRPCGRSLQTQRIDTPHTLIAQLRLRRFEVVPESIPGFGRVGYLQAGLLNKRIPDMKRQRRGFVWSLVRATRFGDAIVVTRPEISSWMQLRLQRINYVAEVHEFVFPSVLRDNSRLLDVVRHHIRNVAAGERRNNLLHQGRKRDEAIIDSVAALFLVVGNHVA